MENRYIKLEVKKEKVIQKQLVQSQGVNQQDFRQGNNQSFKNTQIMNILSDRGSETENPFSLNQFQPAFNQDSQNSQSQADQNYNQQSKRDQEEIKQQEERGKNKNKQEQIQKKQAVERTNRFEASQQSLDPNLRYANYISPKDQISQNSEKAESAQKYENGKLTISDLDLQSITVERQSAQERCKLEDFRTPKQDQQQVTTDPYKISQESDLQNSVESENKFPKENEINYNKINLSQSTQMINDNNQQENQENKHQIQLEEHDQFSISLQQQNSQRQSPQQLPLNSQDIKVNEDSEHSSRQRILLYNRKVNSSLPRAIQSPKQNQVLINSQIDQKKFNYEKKRSLSKENSFYQSEGKLKMFQEARQKQLENVRLKNKSLLQQAINLVSDLETNTKSDVFSSQISDYNSKNDQQTQRTPLKSLINQQQTVQQNMKKSKSQVNVRSVKYQTTTQTQKQPSQKHLANKQESQRSEKLIIKTAPTHLQPSVASQKQLEDKKTQKSKSKERKNLKIVDVNKYSTTIDTQNDNSMIQNVSILNSSRATETQNLDKNGMQKQDFNLGEQFLQDLQKSPENQEKQNRFFQNNKLNKSFDIKDLGNISQSLQKQNDTTQSETPQKTQNKTSSFQQALEESIQKINTKVINAFKNDQKPAQSTINVALSLLSLLSFDKNVKMISS